MLNPRHKTILELLAGHGQVSVRKLAERFGTTLMTIRRDLITLEREGRLVRTHGGAMLAKSGVVEFAVVEKGKLHSREKQAIAGAVAAMIRPGMSLTLDTGTTTLEVAKAIRGVKDLRVLTSSLAIASALYAHEEIELVLLGGTVRKNSPDLFGIVTEDNLARFQVDLAVIGADGLSPKGVFTTDVRIARVSQAMIAGAQRVVLAADSSKFQQTAFVKITGWDSIDQVVTDSGIKPVTRGWLNKSVKTVTYCKVH